jgi:hypothetical protein
MCGRPDDQLENHPWVVEDKMTKTRTGPSETPDSIDELVRDLEESGYPPLNFLRIFITNVVTFAHN